MQCCDTHFVACQIISCVPVVTKARYRSTPIITDKNWFPNFLFITRVSRWSSNFLSINQKQFKIFQLITWRGILINFDTVSGFKIAIYTRQHLHVCTGGNLIYFNFTVRFLCSQLQNKNKSRLVNYNYLALYQVTSDR